MNQTINNSTNIAELSKRRDVKINSVVGVDVATVLKLASTAGTFFGSYLDYTNEVASAKLSLVNPSVYITGDSVLKLSTVKGTLDEGSAIVIEPYVTKHIASHHIEYNNFFNLKPYTETLLYLPLYGYIEIDISPMNNRWLHIYVTLDTTSGTGTYIIGHSADSSTVFGDDTGFITTTTVDFSFTIDIPFGTTNYGDIKRNALLNTLKVGVSAAALAFAPTVSVATASTINTQTTTYQTRNPSSGRLVTGAKIRNVEESNTTSTRTIDKTKPSSDVIKSAIDIVNRNHSGTNNNVATSASAIISANPTNVFILKRRKNIISADDDYNHLFGRPLGIVDYIGNYTGFTKICDVHVEDEGLASATSYEKDLIEQKLYEGVIL